MGSLASRGGHSAGDVNLYLTRRETLLLSLGLTAGAGPAAVAAPQGQLTYGMHVSLAPAWFDPAETTGLITPFLVLYALHDSLVKAMPGQPQASSLAESWSATEDGLTYDFVLRKGTLFHNGDPVTGDDVKFSFEQEQLGCLGLALNAVVHWNAIYMQEAIQQARAFGLDVRNDDLAHLSPLIWRHLNFLGRYDLSLPDTVRNGGLRPLRNPNSAWEF